MGGNPGGWVADRLGVKGTARDVLKDPLRGVAAASTLGQSELLQAADNKLFNDPRNKAEDAGAKQAEAANRMIDQQQEEFKQQDLVRNRDLQRARTRSLLSNRGSRSQTTLTDPIESQGAYVPGRKTLLGY